MLGTNVSHGGQYLDQNAPNRDTPIELQKAWLRFHEEDLCQKIDAAFVFSKRKMEVWVNVKDEKDYKKFLTMLKPLQHSYQIDLHTVHSTIQENSSDITTPPPSFLENSELLRNLRHPFLPYTHTSIYSQGLLFPYSNRLMPSTMYGMSSPPPTYEQRILQNMYEQSLLTLARDTLEYNRRIRLYGAHLPSLSRTAFGLTTTPDLRRLALAVCREHAKKLQKYEDKLANNLSMTLPKASRKRHETTPNEESLTTGLSSFEIAVLLARETQSISNNVYRFIYPEDHTVTLADLRNPSLIQSLETVQRITAEFRNTIN